MTIAKVVNIVHALLNGNIEVRPATMIVAVGRFPEKGSLL
jgi:hypothetical protein